MKYNMTLTREFLALESLGGKTLNIVVVRTIGQFEGNEHPALMRTDEDLKRVQRVFYEPPYAGASQKSEGRNWAVLRMNWSL